jgi:pimeloyl-ACP methyl ester carboxylesterase
MVNVTRTVGIPVTHYRTAKGEDVGVFYREAGPADALIVVLLHGFPTSSTAANQPPGTS